MGWNTIASGDADLLRQIGVAATLGSNGTSAAVEAALQGLGIRCPYVRHAPRDFSAAPLSLNPLKRARYNGNAKRGVTTVLHPRATPERLSMFSDGVFAVLITVLVLEMRPPELPTFRALLLLWPTWLSYAVSYLFIAIVWPITITSCSTRRKPRLV